MNEQMRIIINQMIVFSVLLGIGAVAAKAKVLTASVLDSVAKVVVNITLPALIITLIPASCGREVLVKAIPFLICSFLLILFLFSLGRFSAKIGGLSGNTADVHTAESTFGNVGFMGIPLILALFGGKGMLFISIFSVADHSLLWTLGSFLTSNSKSQDFKAGLKRIVNPTTVALMVALLLVALNIKPKGVVMDTLKGLGDTTKFISMVYLGGTLAMIDLRTTWKKRSIFLIVLSKMILAPIIVYGLLTLNGGLFPREAVMTLTLIAALPSMVTIAMLARSQGSDDVYASECVFVTTIASILTIPGVMWALGKIFH